VAVLTLARKELLNEPQPEAVFLFRGLLLAGASSRLAVILERE